MRGLGDFSISMDRPGVLLTGCPSRSSGSQPSMFYHPAVLSKSLRHGFRLLKGLYWEPQTGNPKNIVGI